MIQQRVSEGTQDWETMTEDLKQLGEKLLGKTSGNMKQGKKTWWWNDDIQESIQTKKLGKRTLDKDNSEENKAAYKTAKKEAKKNVAIAKARAHDHLYADMDTTEGQKKVLTVAKELERHLSVKGDQRRRRESAGGGIKDIGEMEGVLLEAEE